MLFCCSPKLFIGSNPLKNYFHFCFLSKHMHISVVSFKEKQFKNIQKINWNNHRENIISCCKDIHLSSDILFLFLCQMLIWLTHPCIQPYCNFNQVIKSAVISLVHPFTDHCDTLVIDKMNTRDLLLKLGIVVSTAITIFCLSVCKSVIVLNNLA